MACCYDECGDYSVTPVLMATRDGEKCCETPPLCFPCLPQCPRGQVVYCCEKRPLTPKQPRAPPRRNCCDEPQEDCCDEHPKRSSRNTRSNQSQSSAPAYCCPTCCYTPTCNPVKTKYVIPCYRYEDGRIVQKLPVSAFKRNGMQDQEYSKLLGCPNFLRRCPRDVSIECDVCVNPVKVSDPIKVPKQEKTPLNSRFLKKKPIEVSLEDILDD